MIDLSLQKSLYRFKWIDGSLISLKPPTQRVYKEMVAIQNANNDDAIEMVYSIMSEILNNNIQKKELDANAIGLDECILLLQDYFDFYTGELNKIVFQQTL